MAIENVTPNRGYQLPHISNNLIDDAPRLIAGMLGVDLDIAGILVTLLTKADSGHGHVISDVTGLAQALAALQALDKKGQANGYAGLGSDGKVPAGQLPTSLFGALSYVGVWNAATNSPLIPAANAANKGHYYKVSVAGTTAVNGINDWEVGDWIVSNGASWDKIDNTDQVLSVAGLRGAIAANALFDALGLKAAATRNVGTGANTVAAGDDARLGEWAASVVSQAEAEAGAATVTRKWTAERVRQSASAIAIGVGQTWQNVTGSRSINTVFQNTTGKPIAVMIDVSNSVQSVSGNGSSWVMVGRGYEKTDGRQPQLFVVPDGHYYRSNGGSSLITWAELR